LTTVRQETRTPRKQRAPSGETPVGPVTSPDAARATRADAKLERVRRLARAGDLAGIQRELGVPKVGKRGPRGYDERDLDRIGDMYENLRTWPIATADDTPRSTYRTFLTFGPQGRWDEVLEHSADVVDAQGGRREWPDEPVGLVFVADCLTPMEHDDAVRNVAAYLGLKTTKSAGVLIARADRLRRRRLREQPKNAALPSPLPLPKNVRRPRDAQAR
jgi:hypothetical protein